MDMISEIKRIQNLMLINEAQNPLLSLLLDTTLKEAWIKFVNAGGISELDNLDAAAQNQIRNAAKNIIGDYRAANNYLVNVINETIDIIERSPTPANYSKQINQIIKALSYNDEFSNKVAAELMSDSEFINKLKTSLEVKNVNPYEVKKVLEDYVGLKTANKVFNELQTNINLGKTLNKSKNIPYETLITPEAVDSLVNATSNEGIKLSVKKVLGNKNLVKELLKNVENEIAKGTKIDFNWFNDQFSQLVKQSPSFWDKQKQTDAYNLLRSVYNSRLVKTNGKVSGYKVAGWSMLLFGVLSWWAADGSMSSFYTDCLKSKGFEYKQDFDKLKNTDEKKWAQINSDCKLQAQKKVASSAGAQAKKWIGIGWEYVTSLASGGDLNQLPDKPEQPKDETKPEQTSKPDEIKPKTTEFKPQQQPKVPFEPKPNPEIPQTGSKL